MATQHDMSATQHDTRENFRHCLVSSLRVMATEYDTGDNL